jgi:putative chitinase
MLTDKQAFFNSIRVSLFGNRLSSSQVDGITAILNEWERQGFTDLRWLAYMLATTHHETAKTMQPIEEYGKGKGHKYGQKIKRSGVPYQTPDKLYYGRGLVQLTWYENYQLMGRLLGIDLLNKPELACNPKAAVRILFEGMLRGASSFGDFTGRCLEQYFNDTTEDWVNARRIINGLDCAKMIADYGKKYYEALQRA